MESYSYDEHRPVKEVMDALVYFLRVILQTDGLDRLKGMKSQQVHESPYIYLSPISEVVAEVFYSITFLSIYLQQ